MSSVIKAFVYNLIITEKEIQRTSTGVIKLAISWYLFLNLLNYTRNFKSRDKHIAQCHATCLYATRTTEASIFITK